jgi:hypothetical protein
MITPAVTPRGEFVLISLYQATPRLPSCVFVSRMPGHRKGEKRALRQYRNVTLDSQMRLADLVSRYVSDDHGKVSPRVDGWSFQGFIPLSYTRGY